MAKTLNPLTLSLLAVGGVFSLSSQWALGSESSYLNQIYPIRGQSGSGILITQDPSAFDKNSQDLDESNETALERKSASLNNPNQPDNLVRIIYPRYSLDTPTLASQAQQDLLNSEIFMQFFSEQNSIAFMTSNRAGFYDNDKDTVAPIRPSQLESLENTARQQEMARELRKYILIKGLPKFMLSREETKSLGEAIDQTMNAVQNTTSVAIKSEDNKWAFNTGLNPLTGHTYAQFQDETWVISASTNFRNNAPKLEAVNKFGENKQFTVGANYLVTSKTLNPALGWAVSANTTTSFNTSIPLQTSPSISNLVSTLSLSHSF